MAVSERIRLNDVARAKVADNFALNRRELADQAERLQSRPRNGWLAVTNQCNH